MDNEIYGEGNAYDFGARILDPRLGRWLSVDPLQEKYAGFSPFNYCLNNPLLFIDPDGRKVVVNLPSKSRDSKLMPSSVGDMGNTTMKLSFVYNKVSRLNVATFKTKGWHRGSPIS